MNAIDNRKKEKIFLGTIGWDLARHLLPPLFPTNLGGVKFLKTARGTFFQSITIF